MSLIGDKSILTDNMEKSELECPFCLEEYSTHRLPMIVCRSQHAICKPCLIAHFSQPKPKELLCYYCGTQILQQSIVPYYKLRELIETRQIFKASYQNLKKLYEQLSLENRKNQQKLKEQHFSREQLTKCVAYKQEQKNQEVSAHLSELIMEGKESVLKQLSLLADNSRKSNKQELDFLYADLKLAFHEEMQQQLELNQQKNYNNQLAMSKNVVNEIFEKNQQLFKKELSKLFSDCISFVQNQHERSCEKNITNSVDLCHQIKQVSEIKKNQREEMQRKYDLIENNQQIMKNEIKQCRTYTKKIMDIFIFDLKMFLERKSSDIVDYIITELTTQQLGRFKFEQDVMKKLAKIEKENKNLKQELNIIKSTQKKDDKQAGVTVLESSEKREAQVNSLTDRQSSSRKQDLKREEQTQSDSVQLETQEKQKSKEGPKLSKGEKRKLRKNKKLQKEQNQQNEQNEQKEQKELKQQKEKYKPKELKNQKTRQNNPSINQTLANIKQKPLKYSTMERYPEMVEMESYTGTYEEQFDKFTGDFKKIFEREFQKRQPKKTAKINRSVLVSKALETIENQLFSQRDQWSSDQQMGNEYRSFLLQLMVKLWSKY